jgi:predicted molibdopterin-dependent oxidoreductase YjgC
LCDEGRYGFGWVDQGRLAEVRGPNPDATWEQALSEISAALAKPEDGSAIGVIASAQLTSEELFLIRELFQDHLGARVGVSVPQQPGSCDDFLIKSDKYPNTFGATLLGLADGEAPDAGLLVDEALAGNLEVLWVFGHDLVKLFGEESVRRISEQVPLVVFSGTNDNPTASFADWVLPTAAYVEKDGTFVNCHGRVQRIVRAFPPLEGSREDWRILLDLAARLGLPLDGQGPENVFERLAATVAAFESLSYETIGVQGANVATASPASGEPAP